MILLILLKVQFVQSYLYHKFEITLGWKRPPASPLLCVNSFCCFSLKFPSLEFIEGWNFSLSSTLLSPPLRGQIPWPTLFAISGHQHANFWLLKARSDRTDCTASPHTTSLESNRRSEVWLSRFSRCLKFPSVVFSRLTEFGYYSTLHREKENLVCYICLASKAMTHLLGICFGAHINNRKIGGNINHHCENQSDVRMFKWAKDNLQPGLQTSGPRASSSSSSDPQINVKNNLILVVRI